MTSYAMTAEDRTHVQSVYDKVARIEALTEEALAICTDLREDDPIRDNEGRKSPMTIINMLLQIETGLESASDEIPMLRKRLVADFGATPHTLVKVDANTKPSTNRDSADTLLAAFKQLELEKKNEMLKRLIDCQREPAMGPDPVEVVMMGFKQLTMAEKKEMLKRLIDCE